MTFPKKIKTGFLHRSHRSKKGRNKPWGRGWIAIKAFRKKREKLINKEVNKQIDLWRLFR